VSSCCIVISLGEYDGLYTSRCGLTGGEYEIFLIGLVGDFFTAVIGRIYRDGPDSFRMGLTGCKGFTSILCGLGCC